MPESPNEVHYHHYHDNFDKSARSSPLWAVIAIVLALVVVALVVWYYSGRNKESTQTPSVNIEVPGNNSAGQTP